MFTPVIENIIFSSAIAVEEIRTTNMMILVQLVKEAFRNVYLKSGALIAAPKLKERHCLFSLLPTIFSLLFWIKKSFLPARNLF